MPHFVCIHGHFYQPPRESPWLEAIELQEGAYPYHDWNERITAECYEVNALSRILDAQERIVEITNNYEYISFNFGPTLLSWMEHHAPATYKQIIYADQRSVERFSGHGSAIAQVYNHMIMPLASDRDKQAQVRWGIADFRKRFGRDPEGMWLPETAVDLKTLDVLAAHDIGFTILAPKQAARARRIGDTEWRDMSNEKIDTARAYRVSLPSGRSIAVFFYHGPVSQALAFEHLLHSSLTFYQRLREAAGEAPGDGSRLTHVATDGETYGHHHRHGDMALAAVIRRIQRSDDLRLTNYGEFLELHPPEHEVEIVENTSWSCGHGIDRWRSDCGCHSGRHPSWHQKWRKPLREALDWLRDTLTPQFEKMAGELFHDPWAARDAYVDVILDRSEESVTSFLREHTKREELSGDERVTALWLMELQRHLMLMYTSCGWFFDDLSGIETVQVMQYAGRAVQLAEQLFGNDLEATFLDRLEGAPSNDPSGENGRVVYQQRVRPARVELDDVAAHYAMSSLFEDYSSQPRIFCYAIDVQQYRRVESRRAHFAVGRAGVTSTITGETAQLDFGVLHLGDHNLLGFVRRLRDDESHEEMARELEDAFLRADIAEAMTRFGQRLGEHRYTLQSLFRDEQRKILNIVLSSTLDEIESAYRRVYEDNVALLHAIGGIGVPIPDILRTTAAFVINVDLTLAFSGGCEMDTSSVDAMLANAKKWELKLDTKGLGFALQQSLERAAEAFRRNPDDISSLNCLVRLASQARSLPFEIDLWHTQNIYYELLREHWPKRRESASADDGDDAATWRDLFASLGEKLRVKVE